MPTSSPSDLFWTALSPLLQQLEGLGQVLEACATYYAWCTGCAAGVAFLMLGGLVLTESIGDRGGGPTEGERSVLATNGAWASTLIGPAAPAFWNCVDERLGRFTPGPSETASRRQ